MKVLANQIRDAYIATYQLWGGEVIVTVFQQHGAYGHTSAAIVVEHIDSPLETFAYDGYRGSSLTPENPKPTVEMMRQWIADKLTELSTGTQANEGGVGDVEGLAS